MPIKKNPKKTIKELKEAIAPIGELKVGSEIQPPINYKQEAEKIMGYGNYSPEFTKNLLNWFDKAIWVPEIEAYCNEQGLAPADLIKFHREAGKKRKSPKEADNTPKSDSGETYLEKRQREKCGINHKA